MQSVQPPILSDTSTGTCTAATPTNFDFNCLGFDRAHIVIANTGSSNAIGTTKVYVSLDGTYFTEVTLVSSAVGSIAASGKSKLIDLPLAAKVCRVELTSSSGSTASVSFCGTRDGGASGPLRVDGQVLGGVSTTGTVVGGTVTASNLTSGRVTLATTAGQLTDLSGLSVSGNDLSAPGKITAVGDIEAAGGFKRNIGPFSVTLAADQTSAAMVYGVTAHAWVAPRAGSVTALSASLSAAITGSSKTVVARVFKNGSLLNAAFDLTFTTGGAETALYAAVAKDTYTFVAGDLIKVVYTSITITNTPTMVASIEVEC